MRSEWTVPAEWTRSSFAPEQDGWFTTAEVMAYFRWSHRQSVNQVARREGWASRQGVGPRRRSALWKAEDVKAFEIGRVRSLIRARHLKLPVRPVVREDCLDMVCPTCKGFAQRHPDGRAWACVAGHKGDSDG